MQLSRDSSHISRTAKALYHSEALRIVMKETHPWYELSAGTNRLILTLDSLEQNCSSWTWSHKCHYSPPPKFEQTEPDVFLERIQDPGGNATSDSQEDQRPILDWT